MNIRTKPKRMSFAGIHRSHQETERILKELALQTKESKAEWDSRMKKSREDWERQLKKSREDWESQLKKSREDWERRQKETDLLVGKLTNRFGEMVEHLIAPNIVEKFNTLGYQFQGVARDFELKLDNGRSIAEFDFLMENGSFCLGIEVKAKLTERHIAQLEEKLAVLRKYKDLHGDTRKIRGAVATPIMGESVKRLAIKAGFYLIEQSGDTVRITEPAGGPREW